jgi:hypothetical protein
MERLLPVRNELLGHATKAANLLDTANKAYAAERRKIVSSEEARELCVGVLSQASLELAKAVELIARAIPSDKDV